MRPYRIEWKPTVGQCWTTVVDLDKNPGDLEEYVRSQDGWAFTGYWRLVERRVLQETGVLNR